MSETFKLLRQIRSAIGAVQTGTENREHQSLLTCADVVLNELMLRTSSDFYLSYIAKGRDLVEEGRVLAGSDGNAVADALSLNFSANWGMDAAFDAISCLSEKLAVLVSEIDECASPGARSFGNRVSDWEAELYTHSLQEAGSGAAAPANPFTRDAFEAYLQCKFPEWTNLRITRYVALTGGFSKRTVMFDTQDEANGKRQFILRAEQEVSLPQFSDVTQEFPLIKFAVASGLPTPDAYWLESDLSYFGKAFVVMEVAKGENYGWTMGQKAVLSERLVQSIVDTLCAMHNAPVHSGDPRLAESHLAEWLPYATVTEATHHYAKEYMVGLIAKTGIEPTPELARAIRWLQQNVPDVADPPVLVHHDFGLNNLLISGDKVTAILDWEAACIADPAYDILVIQRELADHLTLDEFLQLYRAGTGRTISAYNLAYAQIAAFAIYMIVYLNGRQGLLNNERMPIAMSLLAFRYIANTAPQLNGLIVEAERLRGS